MPYCAMTGRSKPYSWRRASCRAGSIPRSPAMVSIGSPGTSRIRKNAMSVIPRNVGTIRLTRVRKKRNIGTNGQASERPPAAALLLQIHPVEGVPAEGRELEVDDLLAHRLQLHRVRDGEPGGLLLEHDLGLPVELGAGVLVADHLRLRDEVVEALVAPLRRVAAAGLCRVAAKQRVQEVVR